jgi:putative ABC transport system ATP-binding protein
MDRSQDPPAATDTFIQADSLARTYRRGDTEVHALRDLSLTIRHGALALVYGPSGSGKSTLLNLIGGIDRPTSGGLRVGGARLDRLTEPELDRFRRERVGFVFQFNNLLPNLSALENVALPLIAQGVGWRHARVRAGEQLVALGLADRESHWPSQLSGGEQQRVALARAVIARPDLVLADEPTGDLDAGTAETVLKLITSLNRDTGTTFVVASHNPRLRRLASQVIELVNGRESVLGPSP